MPALTIAHVVVSILLIVAILVQNRGAGLGETFGGSGVTYTKRGLEKRLHQATIVLGVLFLALSVFHFVF